MSPSLVILPGLTKTSDFSSISSFSLVSSIKGTPSDNFLARSCASYLFFSLTAISAFSLILRVYSAKKLETAEVVADAFHSGLFSAMTDFWL